MAFRILVECQLCGYEMPVAQAEEAGWLQTRGLHFLCPTCAEEVAALWAAMVREPAPPPKPQGPGVVLTRGL